MGEQPFSRQMEEYLEAMGRLEERNEPVTTSALARECKVSAPSATQMLQKMSELNLVDYTPRGRVTLTPAGRRGAASVMRRHRLWERFLHDVLGLRWDSVHEEACRLEHATSAHVEQQLAKRLAEYSTCPHGHPIPPAGAELPQRESGLPLSELPAGRSARVVWAREEDGALLRQLEEMGLRPGVTVLREAASPETGSDSDSAAPSLRVRVGGSLREVNPEIARQVLVEPLEPVEPGEAQSGEDANLANLAAGETARVSTLLGGRSFVARCLALGFTPGAEVKVVHNCGSGPLIVEVRDVRVALGRGEAQKIIVLRKG